MSSSNNSGISVSAMGSIADDQPEHDVGDVDVECDSPNYRLSPETTEDWLRQRRERQFSDNHSDSSWSNGVDSDRGEAMEDDNEDNSMDEQSSPPTALQPPFGFESNLRRKRVAKSGRAPFVIPGVPQDDADAPPKKRGVEEILPGTSSTEMCKLMVDYLISEGYQEAAALLCIESGIPLPVEEMESLSSRVTIRDLILNGRIDEAIVNIERLCPGLLEARPDVRFHLDLQSIIEMVRHGNTIGALEFAQEHLASENLNDVQLASMEKTFALFAFERPMDSPFSSLLNNSQRLMVSTEVNSAMLKALNRPAAPRLEYLFRTLVCAQKHVIGKTRTAAERDRISTVALARDMFSSADSTVV